MHALKFVEYCFAGHPVTHYRSPNSRKSRR